MSVKTEGYEVTSETKDGNEEKKATSEDSSLAKSWNGTSTRYLFNYFKIYYPKLKRCEITNKAMWKLISDKFKKDNKLNFSPEDIENRWKTLKRNHRKINNRKPVRRKQILEVGTDMDVLDRGAIKIKAEIYSEESNLSLDSPETSNGENVSDESPIDQSRIFDKDAWDDRSTKLLIGYLKVYRPQVICGMINSKQMWQRISDKLKKDYNLNFSSDSCENRTKILRQNFDNVVGNDRKVFAYQKEMSELYEIEKNDIKEVIIDPEDLTQEELQQVTSELTEPHSFHSYVTENKDNPNLTLVYDRANTDTAEETNYTMWDSDATRILISCFKFYNPRVGKAEVKNYNMMWNRISEKMTKEYMLNYSSNACKNRWKVLKRNYELVHTGKRKRSFEFFEVMDELYGKERKEKMAQKQMEKQILEEVVVPEKVVPEKNMLFAEIRKEMQLYHSQKTKIKEEMLEQSRRRNILLAERNALLKKLIQNIAGPFEKSRNNSGHLET